MKTQFNHYGRNHINSLRSLGLLLLMFLFPTILSASNNFTVPITSIDVPENTISVTDLWAIFTLTTTRWSNGNKIIVVLYTQDTPIMKTFVREYFGINIYRFEEAINSKINNGRGVPPTVVDSEEQMIHEISTKPGSIGFVKSYIVVGDGHRGIRRIAVN